MGCSVRTVPVGDGFGAIAMTDELVPLDAVATYIDTYRALDKQIREWIILRDKCREQIETALGESESGAVAGIPTVRWSRYSYKKLSNELLRKKWTEDELADCYATIDARRFTVLPIAKVA